MQQAGLLSWGIINGYPDGTFGGGRTITRAEFAAMAVRFAEAGVSETPSCSYRDVLKRGWAYEAIASRYGIRMASGLSGRYIPAGG